MSNAPQIDTPNLDGTASPTLPDYIPQLRAAVKVDPRDQKQIAIAAGIHPVNLSQFVSGKVKLGILSHQRLAAVLGFRISLEPAAEVR